MKYAWVDMETSGLDTDRDVPFEIAVVLTDGDLEEVSSLSLVVKHPNPKRQPIPMSEEVERMHTKNGLLGALIYGIPLQEIDRALADMVEQNFGEVQPRLAGRGVKTLDEPFLIKYFPLFYATLNPKAMDLNGVRWFLRDVVGRRDLLWESNLGRKAHRAMVDITDHLEEARYYRDLLSDSLEGYE